MDYKICIRTVTFSKHETNSYALSVRRVMYVQNAAVNMCNRGTRKAMFTQSTHSYHILHVSKPTSPDDFDGSVLIIFKVFLCLRVFTFWVPCCDARYYFRMKAMFVSSLSPVVCVRVYILFVICVCLFAHSGIKHVLAHE